MAAGTRSVEEITAGTDVGSAGRAWQQVVCVLMEAHSVDMCRQHAWRACAAGMRHAIAGNEVKNTTMANKTAAPC